MLIDSECAEDPSMPLKGAGLIISVQQAPPLFPLPSSPSLLPSYPSSLSLALTSHPPKQVEVKHTKKTGAVAAKVKYEDFSIEYDTGVSARLER
jgi:hypothetical protein